VRYVRGVSHTLVVLIVAHGLLLGVVWLRPSPYAVALTLGVIVIVAVHMTAVVGHRRGGRSAVGPPKGRRHG